MILLLLACASDPPSPAPPPQLPAEAVDARHDGPTDWAAVIAEKEAERAARDGASLQLDLPLSVEEAYAAIPHRRTAFHPKAPGIPDANARYLQQVFALMDQGVRARVSGLGDCWQRCQDGELAAAQLASVAAAVGALEAPPELIDHRSGVVQALESQGAFFLARAASGEPMKAAGLPSYPEVTAASRHLRQAWQLLKTLHPEADRDTQDAFFDYHCALDFI